VRVEGSLGMQTPQEGKKGGDGGETEKRERPNARESYGGQPVGAKIQGIISNKGNQKTSIDAKKIKTPIEEIKRVSGDLERKREGGNNSRLARKTTKRGGERGKK